VTIFHLKNKHFIEKTSCSIQAEYDALHLVQLQEESMLGKKYIQQGYFSESRYVEEDVTTYHNIVFTQVKGCPINGIWS
jgi:hypothetical protein